MNNLKKLAIVLLVLVIALGVVIGTTACDLEQAITDKLQELVDDAEVTEDTTFVLEVRKYNGAEGYTVNIDGELLASVEIPVKEGQVYVAEAMAEFAPLADGVHKVMLNDTDYLTFTDSWWLTNGYMSKETAYIADDFANSYMAINDNEASNGMSQDGLDGLTKYVIVIDGWDGNTGVAKVW